MNLYPLKLKSVVAFKIGGKSRKEWSIDDSLWNLIKEDKSESFENILLDLEIDHKEALLNGSCKIITSKVDSNGKTGSVDKMNSFFKRKDKGLHDDTRPLFQCITFGSFNVLKVLLKHGADILQVAENQWNIIHYLIAVSRENEKFEHKAVNIYKRLLAELETEDVCNLLMMEDTDGLRPLKLAVHASCLQMFNVIINTPGVYLVNRQRKGLKEVSWYDITEYEDVNFCNKAGRQSKSPINLLSYSERKVLKSDISTDILRKGMLKQWMRRKFLCNAPFIWIWFCLRLVFVLSFYCMISIDMTAFAKQFRLYGLIDHISSENIFVTTNNSFSEYCDCSLTNETLKICYYYCALRNLSEAIKPNESDMQNVPICQSFTGWYVTVEQLRGSEFFYMTLLINMSYLCLYMACSIVFDIISVLTLLCSKSSKWKYFHGKKKDIIASNAFYRVCQFTFVMILCIIMFYFKPLNPSKQDFSDQTQGGLIFTCFLSVWSVLYFVQLMPSLGQFVNSIRRMLGVMFNFVIVYGLMLYPYPHAFMVMLKNRSGCQVAGFETLQSGIYSSFKIMLNMLDVSTYPSDVEEDLLFREVLHMIFVFVIAILLINFLIALLSASVTEVVETGDVIMMIQRISVACTVECRLNKVFYCFYCFLKRLCFTYVDGKVYIVATKITEDINN